MPVDPDELHTLELLILPSRLRDDQHDDGPSDDVKAMQTSDENGIATPEGWQPGDKVIVPPAKTAAAANARAESGDYECKDFYFCTKTL